MIDCSRKSIRFLIPFGALFVLLFSSVAGAGDNPPVITLADGIRLIVENNPSVRAAYLDEAASGRDVVVARSRLLPAVNAAASANSLANQPTAKFGPTAVPTSDRNYASYGVNLNQLVFDSGATGSGYQAAKNSREVKRLAADRTKNTVILNFIFAYFDLLEAEKMLLVSEREVAQLDGHRQTAGNLYDQGVITRNDLLQAAVRLADAQQRQLAVRNLKAINMARVDNSLARLSRDEFQAVEPLDGPAVALELAQAWQAAGAQRPELRILGLQLENTGLQAKAKRAEFFPGLFIQAGYAYNQNEYQIYQDNWYATLNCVLNLFNGGATVAELGKLRDQQAEIAEQVKSVGNDIRLEVEKYFLDLKNAEQKLVVVKDAVAQADENLKINRTRYAEGAGTAGDVLDAITLLASAETNQYRARYDLKRANAGFLYATGHDLAAEYGKQP